jgi:hypothetical protein
VETSGTTEGRLKLARLRQACASGKEAGAQRYHITEWAYTFAAGNKARASKHLNSRYQGLLLRKWFVECCDLNLSL